MLIVVQRGRTKRLILGKIPTFFSAASIVTGNVPADDFEKNATDRAGIIFLIVAKGAGSQILE